MQTSQHEQVVGRLSDAVRPVLCPTCGLGQTIPPASGSDVGRDCKVSGSTWPGRGSGVRAPEPDEKPLSTAEIAFGIERGLI